MAILPINSARVAHTNNLNNAKKAQEDKKSLPQAQHSNPLVKVPYSALMGLLMLASTAPALQSCSKGDGPNGVEIPEVIQDEPSEVSQGMQRFFTNLGFTTVTTKTGAGSKGDIQSFSYKTPVSTLEEGKDRGVLSEFNANLNTEKSTKDVKYYDVTLKDNYENKTTKGSMTIAKSSDGSFITKNEEEEGEESSYKIKKNNDGSYAMTISTGDYKTEAKLEMGKEIGKFLMSGNEVVADGEHIQCYDAKAVIKE